MNHGSIYLDHAATTAIDPRVREAMAPYMDRYFGNPSSVHRFGREARAAVEKAREILAEVISASPEEIVFTSSGTEANNLAIAGFLEAQGGSPGHVITSAIEHPSVLNVCRYWSETRRDVITSCISVEQSGLVSPAAIEAAVNPRTRLISIMHCNNETGIIQPIEEIVEIARAHRCNVHSDAVQSFLKIPLNVRTMGLDLCTLSAHKIYGPKGIGALYVKSGTPLQALLHGGPQEQWRRAGTENVAAIVGFAHAVQLGAEERENRLAHLQTLENKFLETLQQLGCRYELNGSPENRLPGIMNLSFQGVLGTDLLIALDLEGIVVSTGSACSSGVVEASYVINAMYQDGERAKRSIRVSFGKDNTLEEARRAAETLHRIVHTNQTHQ